MMKLIAPAVNSVLSRRWSKLTTGLITPRDLLSMWKKDRDVVCDPLDVEHFRVSVMFSI